MPWRDGRRAGRSLFLLFFLFLFDRRTRRDHDTDAARAAGLGSVGLLAPLEALRADVVDQCLGADLVLAVGGDPGIVAQAHGAGRGLVVDGAGPAARDAAIVALLLELRGAPEIGRAHV